MEGYQVEEAGFAGIMEKLMEGALVRRAVWNDGVFAVMQIPQAIEKDIVPRMTSLPPAAKEAIGETENGTIRYHDQVLRVDPNMAGGASATYYTPTWEDIFADDWMWRALS